MEKWKQAIRDLDPRAEFKKDSTVQVRCGQCGNWYSMSTPFTTTPHDRHLKTKCVGKGDKSLLGMLQDGSWKSKSDTSSIVERKEPCPGLAELQDARIPAYCNRTGALGGGSRSVTKLAQEKFGPDTVFRLLSEDDKQTIRDDQRADHKWRILHREHRVFSTSCEGKVTLRVDSKITAGSSTRHVRQPCPPCAALLMNTEFHRLLKVPMPEPDDFKYLNEFYKDPVLAGQFAASVGLKSLLAAKSERSPLLQYALGVANGDYAEDQILSGLLQSKVMKLDRERNGKGMQNFKWPPEYDHLLHLIEIESPRAYRTLTKYLPGRTSRSFA